MSCSPTDQELFSPKEIPVVNRRIPHSTIKAASGSLLLDQIATIMRRHLRLREAEYVVISSWILHTHCYRLFRHTPYLNISSPIKQSGKTSLIDIIQFLVSNPKRADSISPAVLYRISSINPTLMLDEVDRLMKSNKENCAALTGILNSGFHCKGTVMRCAASAWILS